MRIYPIAASSIVLSVCALFISIWQGIVSRQHNLLSFRAVPFINFQSEKDGKTGGNIWPGWRITNNGGGTGFIKYAYLYKRTSDQIGTGEYKYVGLAQGHNWSKIMKSLNGDIELKYFRHFTGLGPNHPIRAGETIVMFSAEPGPAGELADRENGKVLVAVCLCSIYDECFATTNSSARLMPCEHKPE